MVHSTTPGAFRPAPPRDIYNANIEIRSQRSTAAVVGISHRAREEAGAIACSSSRRRVLRLPRPRARKEYLLLFENKIINTKKINLNLKPEEDSDLKKEPALCSVRMPMSSGNIITTSIPGY